MHRVQFLLKCGAVITIISCGSLIMLVIGLLTGFRAKRFYRETILAYIATFSLRVFGLELITSDSGPLPPGQVVYIANHSSTIDVFALAALHLPNTRFFLWGGLSNRRNGVLRATSYRCAACIPTQLLALVGPCG
jgi:1-acyl-sn-glycerol-3-phosphate acyltransferase